MSQHETKQPKVALNVETVTFIVLGVFFIPVTIVYMMVSDLEPIGSTVFVMLALMAFMIAGYLWLLGRRIKIEDRWEDRPDADISESTGEVGVFSPTSWWPLVAGAGAGLAFLAVAAGWWMMVPAVIVAAIGTIGFVMEFSTGKHAH
ncbi:MAG: cytochrome c oxidase subunit 4 [bacterium]|nr:cytochrome c oxidase subunit 4 [bacterium]